MSSELEVIGTFDTPQTARECTKLLNTWFSWVMEGSNDEIDDISQAFEEFALSFDDFLLDRDTDIDWGEIPEVHLEGNKIVVGLDTKTGVDIIRELFEALGAYDVTVVGDEED